MNSEMGKVKRKSTSSLLKKLEKYLSMKKPTLSKSKSWHNTTTTTTKNQVAPDGCFWVYVGPEKERFVIKTKYANHPSFKPLLEDAVKEYGYNYSQGPILLPCDVDLFYNVLAEIESSKDTDQPTGCSSCSPLFSPARRLGNGQMAKGHGSFQILTPPRLRKLNSFNCV